MRSALVTGSTGFVGAALVKRLLAQGVATHCLTFADRGHSAPGEAFGVESASSSVADLTRALQDLDVDVVFHLAAAGVAPTQRDPQVLLDSNAGLTTRLLAALGQRKPRLFVHTGSSAEYGAENGANGVRRCFSEDQPTAPISLYGAAKNASVVFGAAQARQLAIPFVTLRLFHIYGEAEADYRLFPSLARGLTRGTPVALTAGEQVRDVLYIDDATAAYLAAARSPLEPYRVYNVCSSQPVTVRQIAETFARAMRRPLSLLEFGRVPYRSDEEMWVVGDNRRFVAASGWRPAIDLEEGIRRMVANGALSNE